jgi:hypothetical protein
MYICKYVYMCNIHTVHTHVLNMHMCILMYTHEYLYAYPVYVCMHILYVSTCMCTCMQAPVTCTVLPTHTRHASVHVHACVHTCTMYSQMYVPYTHLPSYTYIHVMFVHMCMLTSVPSLLTVNTYLYVYPHTPHTHVYPHIHTLTIYIYTLMLKCVHICTHCISTYMPSHISAH